MELLWILPKNITLFLLRFTNSLKAKEMCKDLTKIKSIKRVYKEVVEDFKSLLDIMDAFNGKVDEPINRKGLLMFEEGIWYEINPKVSVRRRKDRFDTHLNFDTLMQKGGEFGRHFHSDLIESAEIIHGTMKDLEDGVIYKAGDVMEYDKGQKHVPIALESTQLHVLFKP